MNILASNRWWPKLRQTLDHRTSIRHGDIDHVHEITSANGFSSWGLFEPSTASAGKIQCHVLGEKPGFNKLWRWNISMLAYRHRIFKRMDVPVTPVTAMSLSQLGSLLRSFFSSPFVSEVLVSFRVTHYARLFASKHLQRPSEEKKKNTFKWYIETMQHRKRHITCT